MGTTKPFSIEDQIEDMLKELETRLIVLHADMDAYYATIEQRDNPNYRGKPLGVVLPVNRGPIASASYEAKTYGISSGMSVKRAIQLCPDLILVRGRMETYQKEFQELISIFSRYSTDVYPYVGIDEAFIFLDTYLWEEALDIAKRIKNDVRNEKSLTVSVGIGYNKLAAKQASDLEKPDGLTLIEDKLTFWKKIWPLPVRKLFGIGNSIERKLQSVGINTIGELANKELTFLQNLLGDYQGFKLHNYANGVEEPEIPLFVKRKSYSHGYTFPEDTRKLVAIKEKLKEFSKRLSEELAESNKFARTVTVSVTYEDLSKMSHAKTVQSAMNMPDEIYETALSCLAHLYDITTKRIRRISTKASNLVDAKQLFLNLDIT